MLGHYNGEILEILEDTHTAGLAMTMHSELDGGVVVHAVRFDF